MAITLEQTMLRVAVFIPSDNAIYGMLRSTGVLDADGLEVSRDLFEQQLWLGTTSCSSLILLDQCGTGQNVLCLRFLPSREK